MDLRWIFIDRVRAIILNFKLAVDILIIVHMMVDMWTYGVACFKISLAATRLTDVASPALTFSVIHAVSMA
jgi:hypothetical protein